MTYTQLDSWNNSFRENTNGLGKFDLCMEIGCFEGMTSNYIVDNLLNSNGKLLCVDPLTNNYLNENLSDIDDKNNKNMWKYFDGQYERFIENCKIHIENKKIELLRKNSSECKHEILNLYGSAFDFIYIDGDHRADPVYRDAIMSFELCKSGGYVLFDDYEWGAEFGLNAPKIGIDKFLNEYSSNIKIIIKNGQVLIQKI